MVTFDMQAYFYLTQKMMKKSNYTHLKPLMRFMDNKQYYDHKIMVILANATTIEQFLVHLQFFQRESLDFEKNVQTV